MGRIPIRVKYKTHFTVRDSSTNCLPAIIIIYVYIYTIYSIYREGGKYGNKSIELKRDKYAEQYTEIKSKIMRHFVI